MDKVSLAITETADAIHEEWRVLYKAQNPDVGHRWKPALAEDGSPLKLTPQNFNTWVSDNGGGRFEAFRYADTVEVDILALPNSLLPPGNAAENMASAKTAVDALLGQPSPTLAGVAAMVHEAWVDRNKTWAPESLKAPYDTLPIAEQLKDAAVVQVAYEACTRAGLM